MIAKVFTSSFFTEMSLEFRNKTFLKRFLNQIKIDTNYYGFTVNNIITEKDCNKMGSNVVIDYDLIRLTCWDNLEECEERLKIGL